MREARDQLLSIRRSYQSLAEAVSLRFAALWPAVGDDGSAAVRLNLVWDGRLCEAVSLPSATVAMELEKRLTALWESQANSCTPSVSRLDAPVVVPQKDLDTVLATRRWYKEREGSSVVILPSPGAGPEEREQARERLLAEAWQALAVWPADRAIGSVF